MPGRLNLRVSAAPVAAVAVLAVIFLAVCAYLAYLNAWGALAGYGAGIVLLGMCALASRRYL